MEAPGDVHVPSRRGKFHADHITGNAYSEFIPPLSINNPLGQPLTSDDTVKDLRHDLREIHLRRLNGRSEAIAGERIEIAHYPWKLQ